VLGGHNDTPFGRPTTGRPLGRPGVGHPQGVFGVFSYYQLVTLLLNMVCLTVALWPSDVSTLDETNASIESLKVSDDGPDDIRFQERISRR
jgi:hypothetical protein